jgi:hypothetical protein
MVNVERSRVGAPESEPPIDHPDFFRSIVDFVKVPELGSLKTLDRSELLLRLEEITSVEAGGLYERQLESVHRQNANPT